jgi:hypothetical protein
MGYEKYTSSDLKGAVLASLSLNLCPRCPRDRCDCPGPVSLLHPYSLSRYPVGWLKRRSARVSRDSETGQREHRAVPATKNLEAWLEG